MMLCSKDIIIIKLRSRIIIAKIINDNNILLLLSEIN